MTALVGYARATSGGASEAQAADLRASGCDQVLTDTDDTITALTAALDVLRPDDTLVVTRLDRLGPSLDALVTALADVANCRAHLLVLDDRGVGESLLRAAVALATSVRQTLIAQEEMPVPSRGRGRPVVLTAEKLATAQVLRARSELTTAQIAASLGVSRATLFRHLSTAAAIATVAATVIDPTTLGQ